jgi:hypothetical protein
MSSYEDVGRAFPTLQKQLKLNVGRSTISLQEQFALLHIVARFDMLRWPVHLQWIISNYMNGVENAVTVRITDDGIPARNELIAYCYGGNAASTRANLNPPGPAMLLDCRNLSTAIHEDCIGLMESKKNRNAAAMPPRFARFPERDHSVIADQLLRGLGDTETDECVESETNFDELRIFVGFSQVFDMLRHKQGAFASEDRLEDVLAKRSAPIAEDHLSTDRSVWTVLFRNEKMLRLSTQETSYTTRMTIGSLLAYGLGDGIDHPSLAVVARILRPSNKKVVIDLHLIAQYAEQVLVTVNAARQAATEPRRGEAALLLYDKVSLGGWGLMIKPQDILPGFDQIAMHRKQRQLPNNLKSRCSVTHDFHLYTISLTSAQLGISGEPSYANASVSSPW